MTLENKNIDCKNQITDKTNQQIKEKVWSTIMRIFKSDGSPGIEVSKNNKGEDVVFYPGKYSYKTPFFSLDKKNPPEIIDGKIFSGSIKEITWISKITQKPFRFFIISNGSTINTEECLIFGEPYDPRKKSEEIVRFCFYKFKKKDAFVHSIYFGRGNEGYYFAKYFDGEKICTQSLEWYLEQERLSQFQEISSNTYACFSWKRGYLNEWIDYLNSKIVLGEAGRGRSIINIPVNGCEERQKILFGKIHYFLPSEKEKGVNDYIQGKMIELIWEKSVALQIENFSPENPQYLVLIDTERCYTQGSSGRVESLIGNPKIIINGIKAHWGTGTNERIFQWLVSLSEGDVLLIRPEGAWKTKASVLYVKNKALMTEDYYPRMQKMLKENTTFLWKSLPSTLGSDPDLIGKKISFFYREKGHRGNETSPYCYYYKNNTFENMEITNISKNGLNVDLPYFFELNDDNWWIINE